MWSRLHWAGLRPNPALLGAPGDAIMRHICLYVRLTPGQGHVLATALERSVRVKLAFVTAFLGIGLLVLGHTPPPATADANFISVVTIDGAIDPISARYLDRSIEKAAADGAQLVVIMLDTPGGLLSSTRDMVETILTAKIPVAVYVWPPGARAASAGTFITAAANFAVMAPGTNIGAASPVAASGQDLPTTLAKKINEDTQAFIRSIASARGRNTQALEETVTHARSYSAKEAIKLNVVDFNAIDLTDLLAQLDGRTAKTAAGTVVLHTKDANVREIKRTLIEKFLNVVTNPNLAFVLLTIGGLGILAEFLTPGFIGPGVIGAIALGLALLGMGHLPVSWVGVGLILFTMVLFFLEAQEPGIGIFGIRGVICFVLGALLLFGGFFSTPDIPEPGSRTSVWIIGVISGMMISFLLFFLYLARTSGSSTGYFSSSEGALVGQLGVAVSHLAPSGTIRVADKEWTATTDPGDVIKEGEEVRVIGIYGSVLKISRYDQEAEWAPLPLRSRAWNILRNISKGRFRRYARRQTLN